MKKILISIIALFSVLPLFADMTLYLNTGGDALWNQGGAKFAIYYFNSEDDNGWSNLMTVESGDIYKGTIPEDYAYVKFVRLSSSATAGDWSKVWNKTADLSLGADNLYTITSWGGETDYGEWSTYTPAPPAPAVSYLSPVYNTTGTPTSGIKQWETLSCTTYTAVTASTTTWGTSGNDSWYVVNANTTISSIVTCAGNVHLILMNGYTLTANSGITVNSGSATLTIYAQDTTNSVMGVLSASATGTAYYAGIGGSSNSNGTITINGGIVSANGGGSAAGIGGGNGGAGSNITINGGYVTANGSENAAGIGGGANSSASNIAINGGKVTATGGDFGAGIGGGTNGSGSYITINDGNVTANGGNYAAGIGGGCIGSGSYITINDGNVTANGGSSAAGIGSGLAGSNASNIFVADNILLKADNNNPPTTVIAHSSITTDVASSLADKQYATAVEQTPAISLTVGPSGYATIVTTNNLTVPSDVEVFGYTFDDFSGALIPGDAITAGEILPSGKGYVVKAAPGEYTFEFASAAAGTAAKFESDLTGWTTDKAASEIEGTVYGLGIVSEKVGFYKFSGATIPAGKAVYVKPEN